MQKNISHFSIFFSTKKTRPAKGKDRPLRYHDKKKCLLTQIEKTPERPPPLHRGLRSPCESWVGALHLQLGLTLTCALRMRRGDFF
jgi:hypothetical protein